MGFFKNMEGYYKQGVLVVTLVVIILLIDAFFGTWVELTAIRSAATETTEMPEKANWVIVGDQKNQCWKLQDTIIKETPSGTIYWEEPNGDFLFLNLKGNYSKIKVTNGNWKGAFSSLGISPEDCSH